jgi:aryl-alcohol dehydrogenase-like predicted oxidoreductase
MIERMPPMSFAEKRTLGKTGLKVGRLGISSSFGAPAAAFEEAFERGCNYFTWGKLLRPKKMPTGEPPLSAAECYRFALSHPAVDVCMMGAKTQEELRQNLGVLEQGPLSEREMERVRRIGEHLYGKA